LSGGLSSTTRQCEGVTRLSLTWAAFVAEGTSVVLMMDDLQELMLTCYDQAAAGQAAAQWGGLQHWAQACPRRAASATGLAFATEPSPFMAISLADICGDYPL
jgi:hypothetical protein